MRLKKPGNLIENEQNSKQRREKEHIELGSWQISKTTNECRVSLSVNHFNWFSLQTFQRKRLGAEKVSRCLALPRGTSSSVG